MMSSLGALLALSFAAAARAASFKCPGFNIPVSVMVVRCCHDAALLMDAFSPSRPSYRARTERNVRAANLRRHVVLRLRGHCAFFRAPRFA
jgi:hypothetical protein